MDVPKICTKCKYKIPYWHDDCARCKGGYTDREYIDMAFLERHSIPRIDGVPIHDETREEWLNEQRVIRHMA